MPFAQSVSKEQRLARVVAVGRVSVSSVQAAIEGLYTDPAFESSFDVIVDLSEMEFEPSSAEVRAIASMLGEAKERYTGRVAIVVSGTFMYGIAMMAAAYAELAGFAMRAFQDAESAEGWLKRGDAD